MFMFIIVFSLGHTLTTFTFTCGFVRKSLFVWFFIFIRWQKADLHPLCMLFYGILRLSECKIKFFFDTLYYFLVNSVISLVQTFAQLFLDLHQRNGPT